MLLSDNKFYDYYANALEALARLHNDPDFDTVLCYLKDEQARIAFKSCQEHDTNMAIKKQGAVLLIDDFIKRAKNARKKIEKIKERKKNNGKI